MARKRAKTEPPPVLGKLVMYLVVFIIVISVILSALSGIGVSVGNTGLWSDLLKITFGSLVGYLLGENREKRRK